MKPSQFREVLLHWDYTENNRDMPWKGETDPYKIWLSEIILQQTRVSYGTTYYLKFIDTYPTVFDLAEASLDEVLQLWEGLGYYSRARNLHETAKYIAHSQKGEFPSTYEGLLALKGVGPYTAAAIASFCYNIPIPVIDGNSLRVISRICGITEPIQSSAGRAKISSYLTQAIETANAAKFNQAIMDFGAKVCRPKGALCDSCPMQSACYAHRKDMVLSLPVKRRAKPVKDRYFHYLIVQTNEQIAIQKRTSKDIWNGLYELPLEESTKKGSKKLSSWQSSHFRSLKPKCIAQSSQTLSHQRIHAYFYLSQSPSLRCAPSHWQWVPLKNLCTFAFPKVVRCFLDQKQLTLVIE